MGPHDEKKTELALNNVIVREDCPGGGPVSGPHSLLLFKLTCIRCPREAVSLAESLLFFMFKLLLELQCKLTLAVMLEETKSYAPSLVFLYLSGFSNRYVGNEYFLFSTIIKQPCLSIGEELCDHSIIINELVHLISMDFQYLSVREKDGKVSHPN